VIYKKIDCDEAASVQRNNIQVTLPGLNQHSIQDTQPTITTMRLPSAVLQHAMT
jgi:hypothetical protein